MSNKENQPVLDEQTFEKLLEAAYVLQEHNREMRKLEQSLESQSAKLQQELAARDPQPTSTRAAQEPSPLNGDYTLTLAEIVEAQRQIQVRHLTLDDALAVVAERVARITHSSGAAIGILDGTTVRYRAGSGAPALAVGSETPLDGAICVASVRTGKVIRSEDVNTEFLFDPDLCRRRGILSLLAVPIYRDGDIVGALELYFDRIQGFAEQDIHTCQLMAGLVTEAIGRDAELNLKNSMAAERSTMLAAMEKLKPNPAGMAEERAVTPAAPPVGAGVGRPAKVPCWKCGNSLLAVEQFCGNCGAARGGDEKPSNMQSKFAAAWYKRQSSQETDPTAPDPTGTRIAGDAPLFTAVTKDEDSTVASAASDEQVQVSVKAPATALIVQREDVVWSSAAKARDFLDGIAGTREPGALRRFWRSRRGDFYLAFALILVMVVIRWGIWSNHSVAAGRGNAAPGISHRRKLDPNADLSLFDKLLIGMGLAEAPDAPEYKGNPDAQVWIDLNTALYYCAGSDLYGKTPKGRMSSQRDAQLDQFEPAYRKACD